MRRVLPLIVVGLLVLPPLLASTAAAQAEQQLVEMNREAMDAYNNLDVNRAVSVLEEAIGIAQQSGISGQLLAVTYLNLGIVQIGGLGDKQQGLDSFIKACCIDPATQVDPLLSTPDIQAQFQQAQQMAASGACGAAGVAPPAPAPVAPMPVQPVQPMPVQPMPVQPMQPMMQPAVPGVAQILHQPSMPQISQAPLPIYCEVANPENVEKVLLFYRGLGMDNYKRAEMIPYGSGYAYQISCNDVWEPRVRYYLQAVDDDDRVVTTAGTAQSPFEAPIVTQLQGPGAALPGSTSPGRCVEVECPPGVTGEECEKPLYHGIAEECDSDRDCQPGLMCDDGVCNIPGGLEAPEADFDRPARTDFARGFIQIGMALGMSQVSAGMITDSGPPGGPENVYVTDDPNADNYLTLRVDTPWVADADSWERNPQGTDGATDEFQVNPNQECPADGTVSGPDEDAFQAIGYPYYPTRYCARVNASGFVMAPAMRVAIGYFVLPRLSLAAILRYQFNAGKGTLANMLLGGRGEYLFVGGDVATGFGASLFLGVTAGQIQPQPPPQKANQPAPFLISGIGGANAGFAFRYRFHRNFGLVLAPEFDLQFPNILIHVDGTLSAEAAF
jgi:hypothetical protein